MSSFVELCSGAGGLSLGFIKEGCVPLCLNELDKTCVKTLRANHPSVRIHEGSMVDIDLTEFKGCDILMGGVPCQSFSSAGKNVAWMTIEVNSYYIL